MAKESALFKLIRACFPRNIQNVRSVCSSTSDVVVHTTHGGIRGALKCSLYGDSYFSFERIPFAQPPLNELRFKAPVPAQSWPHLLDCTEKSIKPLQRSTYTDNFDIEGSEDCLHLNVYVKQLNTTPRLPVMVFIYGGGFERGNATRDLYGPDYFMMKSIILVTITYRVSALGVTRKMYEVKFGNGFLSLADPSLDVPGNAGLKDQLLALKWISANAANFNGDAQNITLFGQSSGAASTQYLMLTPEAHGLFHKAILMSGSAFCSWAQLGANDFPQRLAQNLGIGKDALSDRDIFDFLLSQPGGKLIGTNILTPAERINNILFPFVPVVEPYVSSHCIISKAPAELLANAWSNEIPLMIGGCSFEGLMLYGIVKETPELLTGLKNKVEFMLPRELRQRYDKDTQQCLGELLKQTHFGNNDFTLDNLLNYCDYSSYRRFWHGMWRTIQSRIRYAKAPTYLYRFDYDSPTFNHQRLKYCGKDPVRGVAHVDDRSYLFYSDFAWKLDLESSEFRMIQTMIDIWTTFAATSNPTCESIAMRGLDESVWKPLSSMNDVKCFNIAEELTFINLPETSKLKVWDSLYSA